MNFLNEIIAIQVTDKCVAKCRSCGLNSSPSNKNKIDISIAKSLIDNCAKVDPKMIGFVGGECMIYFELLIDLMTYAKQKHNLFSSVSTSGYWAKSRNKTISKLKKMKKAGMTHIMVSVDDFHLEYIPLSNYKILISALKDLGINFTLHVVKTKKSRNREDIISILGFDGIDLRASETNCVKIGRAKECIPEIDFFEYLPNEKKQCSMLKTAFIDLNGNVFPCCGFANNNSLLNCGNANEKPLKTILEDAAISPIFNSIAINGGPSQIFKLMKSNSLISQKEHEIKFSSPCEACNYFLSNSDVNQKISLLLQDDLYSLLGERIRYHDSLEETKINGCKSDM